MEDGTIRIPTACGKWNIVISSTQKILIEVMRSLADASAYAENEDDGEADIKALLKNNKSSSPNNTFGCISN